MKYLLPLLLIVAAALLGQRWLERRQAWGELRAEAAAADERGMVNAANPAPAWLEREFGQLEAAPAAGALELALQRWGPPAAVEGWQHLVGGAGPLAARELARWLRLQPGAGRADALTISPVVGGRAVDLRADLSGPPRAVLPWVAHLIGARQPRGYLTDPGRVHVSWNGGGGLRAVVVVRVHALERFLGRSGSGVAGGGGS